jgi:hypothetical protein
MEIIPLSTTIINNNNHFQPPILLPHSGQIVGGPGRQQLDQAAVDRHIQPQHQQLQLQNPNKKMNGGVSSSTAVKEKIVGGSPGKPMSTTATQVTSSGMAPIMKKQTAKRTRSFAPGGPHGGACSNNQKGGSHSVASTQTGNDKSSRILDVDSATNSNGETLLSIAASQGHYDVVDFLLNRKANIGMCYVLFK